MSARKGLRMSPSPCKEESYKCFMVFDTQTKPSNGTACTECRSERRKWPQPNFLCSSFFLCSSSSRGQQIRGLAKELTRPITALSCWCAEIASLPWLLNSNCDSLETHSIFLNAGKISPALNQFQSCHDQGWKFNFFAVETSILKMSGARLLIFWHLTDRLATTGQLTASSVV